MRSTYVTWDTWLMQQLYFIRFWVMGIEWGLFIAHRNHHMKINCRLIRFYVMLTTWIHSGICNATIFALCVFFANTQVKQKSRVNLWKHGFTKMFTQFGQQKRWPNILFLWWLSHSIQSKSLSNRSVHLVPVQLVPFKGFEPSLPESNI